MVIVVTDVDILVVPVVKVPVVVPVAVTVWASAVTAPGGPHHCEAIFPRIVATLKECHAADMPETRNDAVPPTLMTAPCSEGAEYLSTPST